MRFGLFIIFITIYAIYVMIVSKYGHDKSISRCLRSDNPNSCIQDVIWTLDDNITIKVIKGKEWELVYL